MSTRGGHVKSEIRDCADAVVSWAFTPTTSLVAVISRSALLLIISLAFVLLAIVTPIENLMIFFRGLLWKLARKVLNY